MAEAERQRLISAGFSANQTQDVTFRDVRHVLQDPFSHLFLQVRTGAAGIFHMEPTCLAAACQRAAHMPLLDCMKFKPRLAHRAVLEQRRWIGRSAGASPRLSERSR